MSNLALSHPFEALRARVQGEDAPTPDDAPAPVARLLTAMDGQSASPLDLAVLFRHVLRQEGGALRIPAANGMPSAAEWASVGVTATPVSDGFSVQAHPWKPQWLPHAEKEGVDAAAAEGRPRRLSNRASPDPFLTDFGYDSYRSAGQRRALRAALTAPRGSTLAVSLPTGEGKSLIFHAMARIGLGDGPGVTLVVTPTVALAADHEQSARGFGFGDGPLAYRAGDSEHSQRLIEGIRNGSQALCLASPEAVCTSLSEPLREAARRGRLRAIVIDEAHLIDSWGINFRPEFQMLAGLRRQLLALSRGREFRTVLLSATLTRDCLEVLQTLFPGASPEAPFRVVSATRLRPEIEFWVANSTDPANRESRVIEALHHLPRPLILYTTTRRDAAHWYSTLRERGFQRVRTVTGDTPDTSRDQVIKDWRSGEVDVVVGTSAFGLGIDNSEVRAVVHACVPESLDRFYQEVGRGGRDGTASVSLLLPSTGDFDVAHRLSLRQMLTIERAEHRWRAMFTHPESHREGDAHVVPVDCRPGINEREIDMVGLRNTAWNIRTLVVMAGAGTIQLLDVPNRILRQVNSTQDLQDDEADESGPSTERPRVRLTIDDPMHLDHSFWEGRIATFRALLKGGAARSFEQMKLFLRADRCAAEVLAPLYEIVATDPHESLEVEVGRACGGCPSCREAQRAPYDGAAQLTPYPWAGSAPKDPLKRLLTRNGQLIVFYKARARDALARGRERDAFRTVGASGVRNLVLLDDVFEAGDFADLGSIPLFVARTLGLNDLPPGPTVIAAGAQQKLHGSMFDPRPTGHERIWLLPDSTPHPTRAGVRLGEVPPRVRVLSLAEFVSEVER